MNILKKPKRKSTNTPNGQVILALEVYQEFDTAHIPPYMFTKRSIDIMNNGK